MKPKKKSNANIIIYAIVFVIIIYLSLHFARAYEWTLNNPVIETNYDGTLKEKFNIMGLLDTWSAYMSETPFDFVFNDYTAKVLMITCGFTLIVVAYLATSKKKYISGQEYGSATWGNPKELMSLGWSSVKNILIRQANENFKHVRKVIKKDKSLSGREKDEIIKDKEKKKEQSIEGIKERTNKNSEIILAKDTKFSIFNQEINSNVLIYGGSGAGKTRGIVMPNILNLAGTCSFVVTDPKGEIYQKSGYFLKNVMGYKVRCINLFEKYKSSHYNPLKYIHVDWDNYDWQEDVLTLIDAMIVNLNGGEGRKSNDPFWDDSAKHFIQSLFFYVMYEMKEKDRNMNTIMYLLGLLEIGEENDDYNSQLDVNFEIFKDKFGKDNIAYRTYRDFRTKASGKTAKSIAMTMISKLQPYNIASMKTLSDKDDMELDKLGEEKTAIFVIVPPVSKTFNFVAGMIFTQMFQELNYCANALHGGRLPVPVQFIMDEFANTCIIPNFEQIIAYARSLGIGIMPILQSRGQLKGMYEKTWETISDNCASTVFLGSINSEDTLKAFSERLGKGTFDEKDVSVSKGRSSSTSTSNKKIGRELMTPAEIAKLPKNDCLVFINGKNPLYCRKYNYPKHDRYKYTSDFDSRYLTDFEADVEIIKSPHGEDKPKRKVSDILSAVNPIKLIKDPSQVLEYLRSTYFGSWNFVSDDIAYVNEGENEEEVISSLQDETVQEKVNKSKIRSISDLFKRFKKNEIKLDTNQEEVLNTLKDMNKEKDKVNFVENSIVYTYEGEEEDLLFELEAREDLEKDKAVVTDVMGNISMLYDKLEKDKIKLITDEKEVLETLEDMNKEKDKVNFVEDDIVYTNEGENEVEAINNILDGAKDLSNEIKNQKEHEK